MDMSILQSLKTRKNNMGTAEIPMLSYFAYVQKECIKLTLQIKLKSYRLLNGLAD